MPAPFTYQGNIPQATDQLSVSQADIQTNFASIQSLIDIDHVDFSSLDAGKHAKVSLPVQGGVPVFGAAEVGIFSLLGSTNVNELYIRKNVGGGGTANIAATASTLSLNAAPAAGSEWFSMLPSGLLIKGGGLISQVSPYTFPVAATIPVFNAVLTVLVTVNAPAGQVGYITLNAITTAGFAFSLSPSFPAAASIQYLAIGY